MTPRMLHRLYAWTLALAASPRAPWWLAVISFAESSFFPIPPDALLVPMALARPDRAWRLAFICTVASVVGTTATLGTGIPENGVGEIVYVQGGTRYTAPARAEDGKPIATGAAVIVTRIAGTQFFVKPA